MSTHPQPCMDSLCMDYRSELGGWGTPRGREMGRSQVGGILDSDISNQREAARLVVRSLLT